MSVDRNMDPDTILMLQEIARMAAARHTTVSVTVEGLKLRRVVAHREMLQVISWLDLRNVVGGPVWFVKSNLDYMVGEMGGAK